MSRRRGLAWAAPGSSLSPSPGYRVEPVLVLPSARRENDVAREDVGMLVRWLLHDASIFGGTAADRWSNPRRGHRRERDRVFNLGGPFRGSGARRRDAAGLHRPRGQGWSGLTVQPASRRSVGCRRRRLGRRGRLAAAKAGWRRATSCSHATASRSKRPREGDAHYYDWNGMPSGASSRSTFCVLASHFRAVRAGRARGARADDVEVPEWAPWCAT